MALPANMDTNTWNKLILGLPNPHILQTWNWAKLKEMYGWRMLPQVWHDPSGEVEAAAMVLERSMPIRGFAAQTCILYVPRGPLLNWEKPGLKKRVLSDLQELARKKHAIFIKIDPELVIGSDLPNGEGETSNPIGQSIITHLKSHGWIFSNEQIQFRNTFWLDINKTEEELLANMKAKTRYNLRLAERKGVQVRTGSEVDIPLLYKMYAETSVRDGFIIRPQSYYTEVWKNFMRSGMAEAFIAEVEGQPVAGLVLFHFAEKAWYFYGMSCNLQREKMPNYLLQWKAIQRARTLGCQIYDLWGAPDNFDQTDSMWGIYRFKEGLGAQVIRTIGAWDFTPNKLLYAIFTRFLPKFLSILRNQRKHALRQEVSL